MQQIEKIMNRTCMENLTRILDQKIPSPHVLENAVKEKGGDQIILAPSIRLTVKTALINFDRFRPEIQGRVREHLFSKFIGLVVTHPVASEERNGQQEAPEEKKAAQRETLSCDRTGGFPPVMSGPSPGDASQVQDRFPVFNAKPDLFDRFLESVSSIVSVFLGK